MYHHDGDTGGDDDDRTVLPPDHGCSEKMPVGKHTSKAKGRFRDSKKDKKRKSKHHNGQGGRRLKRMEW
jgi:carbon monoxide dehydrogenase subunit G